jgi:hypothetical protein
MWDLIEARYESSSLAFAVKLALRERKRIDAENRSAQFTGMTPSGL